MKNKKLGRPFEIYGRRIQIILDPASLVILDKFPARSRSEAARKIIHAHDLSVKNDQNKK